MGIAFDTVSLTSMEMRLAEIAGETRYRVMHTVPDAHHYGEANADPTVNTEALDREIRSFMAEIAVAKYMGVYYMPEVVAPHMVASHDADHADVGTAVEVRNTLRFGNPLVVRRKDVDRHRVVVTAYSDDTRGVVALLGWLPALEAWDIGTPAPYDKRGNTRLVDGTRVNPMHYLLNPDWEVMASVGLRP